MSHRRTPTRGRLPLLLLAALALFQVPATPAQAATGAELFSGRCASCHGDQGQGRGSFPALAGNPAVADRTQVENVIRNGRGYMPAFPDLAGEEIAALTDYLVSTFAPATATTVPGGTVTTQATGSAAPTTAAGSSGGAIQPGDPTRGEAYFVGGRRFAEAGAPCAACHSAGGAGGLRGGSLATDLTGVTERFGGEDGVAGALAQPAFLVMRETYLDKPLTAQERADLAAFFATLPQEGAGPGILDAFWVWSGLAAVALFVLMGLAWPRRRKTAVEKLRTRGRGDEPPGGWREGSGA
ncbi:MAG: cytochrome c [Thermoleophilia bacterium]|nr:cytochrome c [Thermoleophilia bacterium]